MNENDQLREQMWDLVYGLTTPEETAALHARIKSDRAAARTYAEVRLEADLVAAAAKVEDSSVTLPQLAPQPQRASAGRAKESAIAPAAKTAGIGWSLHWLGAAAACALAVLMAVGIFSRQEPLRHEVTQLVSIRAYYRDDSLVQGLPQELKVESADAEGKPVSTELTIQVVDADGKALYANDFQTDDLGRAELPLPGEAIKKGAKLRIDALASAKQVAQQLDRPAPRDGAMIQEHEALRELDRRPEPLVEAQLPVRDEPAETKVTFDKDWYEPGDVVRFRAVHLSAFTHQPRDIESLELRLVGPDGNALSPDDTQRQEALGVVTGTFELPEEASLGQYALSVQTPAEREPQAEAIVSVGREQAALSYFFQQAGRGESKALAGVELRAAQPNLGMGVGGGQDRVPSLGKELRTDLPDIKGHLEAKGEGGRAADPTPPPPAPAAALPKEDAAEPAAGRPAKNPQADQDKLNRPEPETAAADAEAPADQQGSGSQFAEAIKQLGDEKRLSEQSENRMFTITAPPQVAGKPLMVEGRYHGIVVSKMELPAQENEVRAAPSQEQASQQLGRSLALSAPAHLHGDMDLYFYDNSVAPPRFILAQRVQLPTRSDFDIKLAQTDGIYAPGQKVRFTVQVTDGGQAAANVAVGLKVAPTLSLAGGDSFAAESLGLPEMKEADDKAGAAPAPTGGQRVESVRRKAEDASPAGATRQPAPAADPPQPSAPPDAPAGRVAESAPPAPLEVPPDRQEAQFDRFSDLSEYATLPEDSMQPSEPVLLASNEASVHRALDKRQAELAARRASLDLWRAGLGRWLLVGGILVLLVLAGAALVQRPAGTRVWAPILGVVAASFLVGFVWLKNQPRRESPVVAKLETNDAIDVRSKGPQPVSAPVAPTVPDVPEPMAADSSFNAPAPPAPGSAGTAGGVGGFEGGGIRDKSPGGTALNRGLRNGAMPLDDLSEKTDGSTPSAEKEEQSADGREARQRVQSPPARERKDALTEETKDQEEPSAPRLSKSVSPSAESRGGGATRRSMKEDVRLKLKQSEERLEDESAARPAPTPGLTGADAAKKGEGDEALKTVWQPLLLADENGLVEIEFTMPSEPGDYRLVLDVHGPGGIGQLEKMIRCEVQPAAQDAGAPEAKP